jgi:predicted transcriptional regulator
MLNRLVAKKLVACDTSDRAHRYALAVPQQAFARSAIDRLKRRFFGGSAEALVVGLVQEELSDKELERLRALIDRRRKERK